MKGSIIAKFRCIEVTAGWPAHESARLVPVMAKEMVTGPDGTLEEHRHPENASFWSATPSGEAKVTCGSYRSSEQRDGKWVEVLKPYPVKAGTFQVGKTYWIRVSPDPSLPSHWLNLPQEWEIDSIRPHPSGSLGVRWSCGGSFVEMTIENRGAIPLIVEDYFEQFLWAATSPDAGIKIKTKVYVNFEPVT